MNALYYVSLDCFQKEFENIYSNRNIYKTAEIRIRFNLYSFHLIKVSIPAHQQKFLFSWKVVLKRFLLFHLDSLKLLKSS